MPCLAQNAQPLMMSSGGQPGNSATTFLATFNPLSKKSLKSDKSEEFIRCLIPADSCCCANWRPHKYKLQTMHSLSNCLPQQHVNTAAQRCACKPFEQCTPYLW